MKSPRYIAYIILASLFFPFVCISSISPATSEKSFFMKFSRVVMYIDSFSLSLKIMQINFFDTSGFIDHPTMSLWLHSDTSSYLQINLLFSLNCVHHLLAIGVYIVHPYICGILLSIRLAICFDRLFFSGVSFLLCSLNSSVNDIVSFISVLRS